MEKIRLKNGQEFNIPPNAIQDKGNKRLFTIYSEGDPISHFTEPNIDRIEYIGEDGNVSKTYFDAVKATAIYTDFENGTYTVEISIDAVEKRLKQLTEGQTYAELALVEVYEMFLGVIMNG